MGYAITSPTHIANLNSLRYRGYVYDTETKLYYLQSRYYDPQTERFISPDVFVSTGQGIVGHNMFAYCDNNSVNRVDSTGEAWWHWAIGAVIVAACAVATVITCGGFAAAVSAVSVVACGVAAASTASTVAAGALIGSATVYGMAVVTAAATSNSVQEFNSQGNWVTVATTAIGGAIGGYNGYTMSQTQMEEIVKNDDPFLPDEFYSKNAPKQSTPNSSYVNHKYNDYTKKYETSTSYYDFAGRQFKS
ncbi:MAG: RHS repeat-associated core domain-containing protein [Clostridia bacterium]|nr:RHS repeat-associated core domain-containing protein [Clostridia bacterium]